MGLDWHRIAPDKSTGGANLDGNSLECFSPRDFHHVSWLRMSRVGFEEDLYIDRNPKDAGYLGGCLEDAVEQYYEERRNWLTEWLDLRVKPGSPYEIETLEQWEDHIGAGPSDRDCMGGLLVPRGFGDSQGRSAAGT